MYNKSRLVKLKQNTCLNVIKKDSENDEESTYYSIINQLPVHIKFISYSNLFCSRERIQFSSKPHQLSRTQPTLENKQLTWLNFRQPDFTFVILTLLSSSWLNFCQHDLLNNFSRMYLWMKKQLSWQRFFLLR